MSKEWRDWKFDFAVAGKKGETHRLECRHGAKFRAQTLGVDESCAKVLCVIANGESAPLPRDREPSNLYSIEFETDDLITLGVQFERDGEFHATLFGQLFE